MIAIACDVCVTSDGFPMPADCEWNAHFHKHTCVACGKTWWLLGGPADDDWTHTRSLFRGHCHQLPKVTP